MPYQKQVVIQQLVLIHFFEVGCRYLNLAFALERHIKVLFLRELQLKQFKVTFLNFSHFLPSSYVSFHESGRCNRRV